MKRLVDKTVGGLKRMSSKLVFRVALAGLASSMTGCFTTSQFDAAQEVMGLGESHRQRQMRMNSGVRVHGSGYSIQLYPGAKVTYGGNEYYVKKVNAPYVEIGTSKPGYVGGLSRVIHIKNLMQE